MTTSRHSANVSMYIEQGGVKVDVWGCLDSRVILRSPALISAGEVDFVIIIDGVEIRRRARLPLGANLNESELNLQFLN